MASIHGNVSQRYPALTPWHFPQILLFSSEFLLHGQSQCDTITVVIVQYDCTVVRRKK
jgi:hypothetical protein